MKKWIVIIILILVSNIVIGDEGLIERYKPNEIFDLSVHLSDSDGEELGANCKIQIRNESFNTILNDDMNEIGGGWYNYTYNTSQIGKYLCRQNCTSGSDYVAGTCDFIIGEDDSMLLGMIVFIPLFIASFLLALAWYLPKENNYWSAIKIALPFLALIFVFQSYQYGVIAISETVGSNSLINAIGDNTFIFGMVFWFLMAILIITIVYQVFMLFGKKKHKTGEY